MRLCRKLVLILSTIGLVATIAAWTRSHYVCDLVFFARHATITIVSDSGYFSVERDIIFRPANPPSNRRPFFYAKSLSVEWHAYAPGTEFPSTLNGEPTSGFQLNRFEILNPSSLDVDTVIGAPYWALAFTLILAWFFPIKDALIAERRWRSSRCMRCGYDLRATTARCPECGESLPTAAPNALFRRAWRFIRPWLTPRRLALQFVACAIAAAILVAVQWLEMKRQIRQAGVDPIHELISKVCLDETGQCILRGERQSLSFDIDLKGDGQAERVIFIGFYDAWGPTPQAARANFAAKRNPFDNPTAAWLMNGLLILERNGDRWEPLCYAYEGHDGMDVTIATAANGLPYFCTGSVDYCHAWGARTRGGPIGPLVGIKTPFGVSLPINRFETQGIDPP